MNRVYILLGGNLGNREKLLSDARGIIHKEIGAIITLSSLYETEAWGFKANQPFLNQVMLIETEYSAIKTLSLLLKIEKELGRKRSSINYESRVIDLDILFYNDIIMDEEQLILPHPRLHLRMFTLIPLNEIAPKKTHPLLNERIDRLMERCNDSSKVNLYQPLN